MTFKDLFNSAFLEGYTSTAIDVKTIIISLLISVVLGLYIFAIYKAITRKTFYSKTFNMSLVGMAVITAAIILTIQSNIVLSLGMVGALSIVRFRTAVKDPLDLVFLYWSISVGIICGAGLTMIAIVVSLVITAVVFLMHVYPGKKTSMILVVNSKNTSADEEIVQIVKKQCKHYKVKSRNLTATSLDMIIEVFTCNESELLHQAGAVDGVTSVNLLAHDGEITA